MLMVYEFVWTGEVNNWKSRISVTWRMSWREGRLFFIFTCRHTALDI